MSWTVHPGADRSAELPLARHIEVVPPRGDLPVADLEDAGDRQRDLLAADDKAVDALGENDVATATISNSAFDAGGTNISSTPRISACLVTELVTERRRASRRDRRVAGRREVETKGLASSAAYSAGDGQARGYPSAD
jgi:hypothetical protein